RLIDGNKDGSIAIDEAQAAENSASRSALRGHFFLGPPLSIGDRLFSVTECDGRLNLVELSAATGETVRIQGIGYAERPIDEDSLRYSLDCTPVEAEGILLVPTQLGVLVAIDLVDRDLLWTYYY